MCRYNMIEISSRMDVEGVGVLDLLEANMAV